MFLGPGLWSACTQGDAQAVRQTSVGLWAGGSEAGLGVQVRRLACLRPECQVVIWAEDESQVRSLKALAGDLENVCVVR